MYPPWHITDSNARALDCRMLYVSDAFWLDINDSVGSTVCISPIHHSGGNGSTDQTGFEMRGFRKITVNRRVRQLLK